MHASLNGPRANRIARYDINAALLVVIVYLMSLAMPSMPSPVVVLFWVAFTLVSMLGILYQASIAKANRQQKFASGGIAARIDNGRSIRVIVSFVASAVLMASLLLESPKWDAAEWALIVATIALYPPVEFAVARRALREYEPMPSKATTPRRPRRSATAFER